MDFLRLDWFRFAGFLSPLLEREYEALVESLGRFELDRQFRAAVVKNRKVILSRWPEEMKTLLFAENGALRPLSFTEELYDTLCAFLESYTGSLLARLKREGILPLAPEDTSCHDLRAFLALKLYDLTVIEAKRTDDTVEIRVDTYGGFTTLRFLNVSHFDYDGSLAFNTYFADELFRLPDCMEFNLAFPDGGLRVHFTDFRLERDLTAAIGALL